VDLSETDIRDEIQAELLPQLMGLYAGEWWSAGRTSDDVAHMLQETDLLVTSVHRPTDRLVGFARVITDFAYLAVILDVIVAPDWRGSGLGSLLVDTIVGHARLARVQSLELVCQPSLVPFYSRHGFTDRVGGSRLMRRTAHTLLLDPEGTHSSAATMQ
jgi:GNAT superfamily N-acetyltransferase